MAGAVSAGAYTAGVMDFLLEALELWERNRDKEGVPSHEVVVRVMGGASAGGMTTMISAAALANKIDPLQFSTFNEASAKKNRLYDAWVNLVADEMMPIMLGLEDLHDREAVSILNSDFIEHVADRALTIDPSEIVERPYVDKQLELFVTLSNVNGIPYELGFRANADMAQRYRTRAHNDIGLFRLNAAYQSDGRIPLSFIQQQNVHLPKACAMATGAFPIGLASRKVVRENRFLQDNRFINRNYPNPLTRLEADPLETLNVDGGMINNEPFEVTRALLLEKTGEDKICELARKEGKEDPNKNHNTFKSSVVLIDPFPSEEDDRGELSRSLLAMVGNIYNTMRGQLLFKPEDIEAALNENNFSRFMIAPKRTILNESVQGARAIACGSVGGFGGFLDKKFRIHDYFLGRRNCQRFLQESFTVPQETANEIFTNGFRHVPPERFRSSKGHYQIIPVLNNDEQKFPAGYDWPSINLKRIDDLNPLLKKRLEKVAFSLMKDAGFVNKVLAFIGSRVLLRRVVAKQLIKMIKKDLQEHKLVS
jgi:hypothetical protein